MNTATISVYKAVGYIIETSVALVQKKKKQSPLHTLNIS